MLLASQIILFALDAVALFIISVAVNNITLTKETGILHLIPARDFKVIYSLMWVVFIVALILIELA